jgi:hypothetical protein
MVKLLYLLATVVSLSFLKCDLNPLSRFLEEDSPRCSFDIFYLPILGKRGDLPCVSRMVASLISRLGDFLITLGTS